MNDCGRGLSREHFISEGILRRLNTPAPGQNEGALRVVGLPWLEKGVPQSLPPTALASRILCDRHNSALSPLDTVAGRFFDRLEAAVIFRDEPEGETSNALSIFSGLDVERWMLKLLCGLAASGNMSFSRDPQMSFAIPNEWLEILFEDERFPDGQGFYAHADLGHQFETVRGVLVRPLAYDHRLAGLRLSMQGVEFLLNMLPPELAHPRLRESYMYRPLELHFTIPAGEHSIALYWEPPHGRGTIHVTMTHK